jgi:hypothetical protein
VTRARRRSAALLAARVAALALIAGGLVAWMALGAGLDACGGHDAGCVDLVRTLAERTGLAVAAATAVIVLTMVGLARTPPTSGVRALR